MARPQPQQAPPPVQRLRVRYAKRGRLRFASHRDFARAFERALRRAEIPMAYSSGFSPHPRISYANAAPTGAATEAEYLEIALAERRDPAEVQRRLDAAMPPGMDVVQVVESAGGSLADRLTGSRWRVEIEGVSPTVVERAVQRFLAAAEVPVSRLTKSGMREFDARVAVVRCDVEPGGVLLTVRHGTPLVRPDDVLTGLATLEPEFVPSVPPRVTRLAQGTLEVTSEGDTKVLDPLAAAAR